MAGNAPHPPGTFCWIELGTTDQEAAKAFYGGLFGWKANDSPMGGGEVSTIFELEGEPTAAAYNLGPRAKEQPPAWGLYIAVEDADRSAARVTELGGTVLAPPFDVMDAGRMAPVVDPTGAHFCLWQAKRNTGLGGSRGPGTLCWADLNTKDVARASSFYGSLVGWTFDKGDGDDYLHIKYKDDFIGGIPTRAPQGPPHWLSYFEVADCRASLEKAKSLGARVYLEPMSLENVGVIAVLMDPQGAGFALYQGTH